MAGAAYWLKSTGWGYETAAQAGLDGRRIKWPRGRVLGGSSSINGMMYMRGNRADYDMWAQAGCAGWSYADVLPYFLRSEDHPERAGDPFHGVGGPLRTIKSRGENPLYASFLQAGRAEGARANDDFNGAEQEGLGLYDFNIRDGRRESTATAFLRPAMARANLTVWTGAQVARVVIAGFKGSSPREVGAAMLVWADGQSGTIGGGALEWQAVQRARQMLATGGTRLDHEALGPKLGQCCGGAVTLLTEVYCADTLPAATPVIARSVTGSAMPLAVKRLITLARGQGAAPAPQLLQGWMVEPLAAPSRQLWVSCCCWCWLLCSRRYWPFKK